jgi:hypothetical protein
MEVIDRVSALQRMGAHAKARLRNARLDRRKCACVHDIERP